MRLALWPSDPDKKRTVSFLLTVAVHLLIVWLLLRLGPSAFEPKTSQPSLTTFDVLPNRDTAKTATARSRAAAAKPRGKVTERPADWPPPPVVPPLPQAPRKPAPPDQSLFGDKSLSGFDLSDMKGDSAARGDDAGDSVAAYGPGEGPGGQHLFNAQWYREPSDAELATYMPHDVPPGSWGMIACQTVEKYHVENCRQIGEGPLGSGIARGMREAAWQFLVIPPRKNGKAVIGAWVRIRIDFTERGVKL